MQDILIDDYELEYETRTALAKDLVFMGGRKTVSLNGDWHYAIDQYNTCLRQKWFLELYKDPDGRTLPVDFSFDEWPTMPLPSNFNLMDDKLFWYEGTLVYTRTFSWDRKIDEKVLLRIGAANYKCRVFLNGEYVCQHRGGSTPFMADVTELLKKENRIILVCDSTRNHYYVPTENTDWFLYGGVYRDVELVSLPKSYIKDFRVSLVPGSDFGAIKVAVKLSVPEGKVRVGIKDLKEDITVEVHEGSGEAVVEAKPELWSPENPKLYDVEACFGEDRVSDCVGFREIRVEGLDILLNGKKIFLRGACMHEDTELHGKAMTDEDRIEAIHIAKELGANYLRLAHYPHHENMAKLCDREGLLLWEEIPVYWAIAFENQGTYESAKNQLEELMTRDYNRASVIIWSVGNENADTDARFAFMGGLADFAHAFDDTRMVSAACLIDGETNSIKDRLADKLDIIGLNEYLGWYVPNFKLLTELFDNSHPTRPVIISEFGGDAKAGYHGSVDQKGTEECQEAIYKKQVSVFPTIPYIKGTTPWILFDFRCPRRTSALQNYYNLKGLVSADRKYHKPAFYVMQEFYRKIARDYM